MEGIDAAMLAKEMLGLPGVELVERQRILALQHLDSAELCRHGHRPTHAAKRTIAAPRGVQTVAEQHGKAHCAAVAGGLERSGKIKAGGWHGFVSINTVLIGSAETSDIQYPSNQTQVLMQQAQEAMKYKISRSGNS